MGFWNHRNGKPGNFKLFLCLHTFWGFRFFDLLPVLFQGGTPLLSSLSSILTLFSTHRPLCYLTKGKKPQKTMTDVVYLLLVDENSVAENLLHALEEATRLHKATLELVESFTDLGSQSFAILHLIPAFPKAGTKCKMGKVWNDLIKFNKVLKSELSYDFKSSFLWDTVNLFFFYGSSSWTPTKKLESRLDGHILLDWLVEWRDLFPFRSLFLYFAVSSSFRFSFVKCCCGIF